MSTDPQLVVLGPDGSRHQVRGRAAALVAIIVSEAAEINAIGQGKVLFNVAGSSVVYVKEIHAPPMHVSDRAGKTEGV